MHSGGPVEGERSGACCPDVGRAEARGEGRTLRDNQEGLGKGEPLLKYDEKNRVIVLNTDVRPVKRKKADNLIRFVVLAYHISKQLSKGEDERYENFYNIVKEIIKKMA